MSPSAQLRTLRQHLREHGIKATAIEVSKYARRTIDSQLNGLPGNYRIRFRLLTRRYEPEAITPMWVSPDQITALSGGYERRDSGHLDYVPQFKPREAGWDSLPYEQSLPYGTVKGGDWDTEQVPFETLLMYRGVRERFADGVPWHETVYHEELVTMFEKNGWSPADARARADTRCEKLDSLAATLTEEGYQSQRALNGHPLHEVTVTIARDGSLRYNCEGRNRLCLAKVLGIERIPVLVLVKHSDAPQVPSSEE